MAEAPVLSSGVLRAVAAIVEAAAQRRGDRQWKTLAARVLAAADGMDARRIEDPSEAGGSGDE